MTPKPPPHGEKYDPWFAARPPEIKEIATFAPIGSVITDHEGIEWYVIGWGETTPCEHGQSGAIIISPIWPGDDYDASMRARQYIHTRHLVEGDASIRRYNEVKLCAGSETIIDVPD